MLLLENYGRQTLSLHYVYLHSSLVVGEQFNFVTKNNSHHL